MEFDKRYVRKPFVVEAVEVTDDNLEELSQMLGKLQYDSESGKPYIKVNSKVVPNVGEVHVGYFVTRMGPSNIRCYAPRVFASQFVESNLEIENWVNFINGKPALIAPVPSEA